MTTPSLAELMARSYREDGTAPEGHVVAVGLVRIFKREGVEVVALQGLDLDVERGEHVAIVGASGSGKSTLLNILSGLDVPTAGDVNVAGVDLVTMDTKARRRYRRDVVGFVWQETGRNLFPFLTAADNVALPLALSRRSRSARRHRSGELLDLLGVGHCRDRRPAQMSGGELQRVAIAVAIANEPSVVLADEPTGELDSHSAGEVHTALRAVNRELGTTVVVVTHDPLVAEHVDRTVAIRDGRTASEVVRRTSTDVHGEEQVVAEEWAVLDRVGRLQLPHDFTAALGLERRVRLALELDHIGVWPDRSRRDEQR